MNRLILISGDLASGKSTLADSLSVALNIPCFEKDKIKERLCDMYGFKTREENLKHSIAAVNEMIDNFISFSKENKDIILEANFHKDEIIKINELADKTNYEVTFIVLTANTKLLYQRFLERVPTRHPAHMSMHLDKDFSLFEKYIEEGRNEQICFKKHIINIENKSKEQVLDEALNIINSK